MGRGFGTRRRESAARFRGPSSGGARVGAEVPGGIEEEATYTVSLSAGRRDTTAIGAGMRERIAGMWLRARGRRSTAAWPRLEL